MRQALKNGFIFNYDEYNTNASNALVFIHGNSHSHRIFRKQAKSDLLKDFRLILLDLPGHGDSEHLSNYSLPEMAKMFSEFIQLKQLEKCAIVGHSFGGHVALHSLSFINPKGLFIFGTPPVKKPFDLSCFLPNPKCVAIMKGNSSEEELEALMVEFNYAGIDRKLAIEDYLQTDRNFRDTIFKCIPKNDYYDEVELIKNYKEKCKILICNQETVVCNNYIERNLRKEDCCLEFSYLDSKHSPQLDCAEDFNLILRDFAHLLFGTK